LASYHRRDDTRPNWPLINDLRDHNLYTDMLCIRGSRYHPHISSWPAGLLPLHIVLRSPWLPQRDKVQPSSTLSQQLGPAWSPHTQKGPGQRTNQGNQCSLAALLERYTSYLNIVLIERLNSIIIIVSRSNRAAKLLTVVEWYLRAQ
jgi:hypothetical protein